MRRITSRLRLFAAVLGLAQAAVPALAVAHELTAADYAAAVAHAEPLGATHEGYAHLDACGLCRNLVSKVGLPPPRSPFLNEAGGSRGRAFAGLPTAEAGDDGPVTLPRAPPVG